MLTREDVAEELRKHKRENKKAKRAKMKLFLEEKLKDARCPMTKEKMLKRVLSDLDSYAEFEE